MKSIEQRKQDFKQLVWDTIGRNFDTYPKQMIVDFFEYWVEHNDPIMRNTKLRFEKEKTFQVSRRLSTWKKNCETYFGKNLKPGEEKMPNYLNMTYLKKISGEKYTKYIAHLKELGYIHQPAVNGQAGYFINPKTNQRTWI